MGSLKMALLNGEKRVPYAIRGLRGVRLTVTAGNRWKQSDPYGNENICKEMSPIEAGNGRPGFEQKVALQRQNEEGVDAAGK